MSLDLQAGAWAVWLDWAGLSAAFAAAGCLAGCCCLMSRSGRLPAATRRPAMSWRLTSRTHGGSQGVARALGRLLPPEAPPNPLRLVDTYIKVRGGALALVAGMFGAALRRASGTPCSICRPPPPRSTRRVSAPLPSRTPPPARPSTSPSPSCRTGRRRTPSTAPRRRVAGGGAACRAGPACCCLHHVGRVRRSAAPRLLFTPTRAPPHPATCPPPQVLALTACIAESSGLKKRDKAALLAQIEGHLRALAPGPLHGLGGAGGAG